MKLVLPFALVLTAGAVAEPFNSELSFSRFDTNYSSFSSNNLGYRYYLTESNTGQKLPYDAIEQFGRRSSVALNYLHSELEASSWYGNESTSFNAWQLGGIYQSTEHDWYFSVEHLKLTKFSSHKTSFSAGYFIQPGWLVKLHVQHEDVDGRDSYQHYGVSSEKIWAFDSGRFLSFSASYFNNEGPRGDGLALALDYYFNSALSVGVFISDDIPGDYLIYTDRAGLRSSWFVTPKLKIHASVGLEDVSDSEYAWDFGVSYRF